MILCISNCTATRLPLLLSSWLFFQVADDSCKLLNNLILSFPMWVERVLFLFIVLPFRTWTLQKKLDSTCLGKTLLVTKLNLTMEPQWNDWLCKFVIWDTLKRRQYTCGFIMFVRFSSALQCEVDMRDALEKKAFDRATMIITSAIETASELHNNDTIVRYRLFQNIKFHFQPKNSGYVGNLIDFWHIPFNFSFLKVHCTITTEMFESWNIHL